MSDMFLGSQAPLYQNVCITRRSKTGKILERRTAKNRVTRLMLYGIGKFLLGQFNNSSPDKIYEYIPRYLALGTNVPGPDSLDAGVTITSSVNDTRLLNEIKYASTTGATESVKRVWIAERNMCKLNTKFSDPYIKVSIKTYISSNHYDGMSIGEAGLFSKEKDNNCLARVCFPPIVKNPNEVLDIQWDITLLSYGETKYPEKIEIENGSKITLPLKYTNKFIKTFKTNLKIDKFDRTIGTDETPDLFSYDDAGYIHANYTLDEYKNNKWYNDLKSEGLSSILETFLNQFIGSKLDDLTQPYYLIDTNQNVPIMAHFGALWTSIDDSDVIGNNELCITLLMNTDITDIYNDTGWTYKLTETANSLIIYSPESKTDVYKVIDGQFYKKSEDSKEWFKQDAFLYEGLIVSSKAEPLGYSYSNNHFYEVTSNKKDVITNQFLNYSNTINPDTLLTDETYHFYKYDKLSTIQRSGYTLDYKDNQKIYFNGDYTDFHLSNDGYWTSGEYEKLIPIITPTNATDKSVTWFVQNTDIVKLNWDGVVTGWNLGETTAIATTTNDLRAKCIIDVVKESKYVAVESIKLNPEMITLVINRDANTYYTVSADVYPLFATNPNLVWSLSQDVETCVKLIHLGDNKVQLALNSSGNVGTGYLTATAQNGLSAECLVKVTYEADNDCDCPDISHLQQEG